MRRGHFETLRPVCPVCRAGNDPGFNLRIAQVGREEEGHIIEGVLHCTNENCLREFPILDGIPLILTNIRQYVSDNILAMSARRDLSDLTESVLGDCCGPGSAFDVSRQHLSSYTWDHYGDLDPDEPPDEPRPGSMLRNLELGLEVAGVRHQSSSEPERDPQQADLLSQTLSSGAGEDNRQAGHSALSERALAAGPVIDVGCSVGRGSFALAEHTHGLVLGVDLHFAMLRLASEVLRHGVVRYPRRRAGLVYDRREFPTRFANMENVDFWACDATALPFPDGTFSLATNMSLLDCVAAPHGLLVSLARVLREGGRAILTCPYDWSPSATPVEAWVGGHSQRSSFVGSPEAILRTLLTPGAHPNSITNFKLFAERDPLAWQVRLHDRSTMMYKAHLLVAEKLSGSGL